MILQISPKMLPFFVNVLKILQEYLLYEILDFDTNECRLMAQLQVSPTWGQHILV